jgi:hypothetical protein
MKFIRLIILSVALLLSGCRSDKYNSFKNKNADYYWVFNDIHSGKDECGNENRITKTLFLFKNRDSLYMFTYVPCKKYYKIHLPARTWAILSDSTLMIESSEYKYRFMNDSCLILDMLRYTNYHDQYYKYDTLRLMKIKINVQDTIYARKALKS